MADRPPYPDTGDDTGLAPDGGSTTSYPGTPRWVKIVGIIVLVLVLVLGIVLLTGIGGAHGPVRHMPSGGASGHRPPFSAMETTQHSAVALVATHRP
jgi:hypothetical protein